MQATKSMSGLTMRPNRNISRFAATISPAMQPDAPRPAGMTPMQRGDHRHADRRERGPPRARPLSVGPSQAKAAAMSQ